MCSHFPQNLRDLRRDYKAMHIPLHVPTLEPRKSIPSKLIDWCQEMGATHLYGNIEHEVDELRRDIEVYETGRAKGIEVIFVQDLCLVAPGKVLTKVRRSLYSRVALTDLHSKARHIASSARGSRTGQVS
jgi:deoxyribodipyrimidine photo-lyase